MTSILNGYSTLKAVKELLVLDLFDATDDSVLNSLINSVSRFIDDKTRRTFYPRIEARKFDTPADNELWVDDDLLEVISVTNADAATIAPTEYNLLPANAYPKYAIRLRQSTNEYWKTENDGDSEQVITINAIWAFRQQYSQRGWVTATTLGVAMADTTTLTFTATSGTPIKAGNIVRIGNELMNVSDVTTNVVTVLSRGDNGSTAATHLINVPVYVWQVEPDIELACQTIVKNLFHNRQGQNTGGVATVTGAGVVITPEATPASAMAIIKNFIRII